MKLFIAFILLTFSLISFASLPPTSTKGNGDTKDYPTFKFNFPNFSMTHTGISSSLGILNPTGGGTGLDGTTAPNGSLLIGNGAGYSLSTVLPTTNQTTITNGVGTLQIGTVQDINTTSNPTFNNLLLGGDVTMGSIQFNNMKLGNEIATHSSTGMLTGGVLSINVNPALFDLSAGTGIFSDYSTNPNSPTVKRISFPGVTGGTLTNLATAEQTYIFIDTSGNILQQTTPPTPTQRRANIFIGRINHPDHASILAARSLPDFDFGDTSQLFDFFDALGAFNVSGNGVTANGANLSINKSNGYIFRRSVNYSIDNTNPHSINTPNLTLATFYRSTQSSVIFTPQTLLDVGNYDVGGVVTPVPGPTNTSTVQRVYLFPSNIIVIQYGQATYTTLASAISSISTEPFIPESLTTDGGVLIAYIAVSHTCTSLLDTNCAQIINAGRFASVGGGSSLPVTNLQQAYNNSVQPQIVLNSSLLGLQIRDASTPIGVDLFNVQNNAGTSNYLGVSTNGVSSSINLISPLLTISDSVNTAGQTLGSFYQPNLNNGAFNQITVGRSASANQSASLNFTYNSATPSNSYLSLGISGVNTGMLNLNGNGALGLNTSYGTNGYVLTSSGSGAPPTWTAVGGVPTQTIASNTTWSTPTTVTDGALITINTGVILTINTTLTAGAYQIFAGPGTVSFGANFEGTVYPEWFGAKGDGITDDAAAIQAAINSLSGTRGVIKFGAKTYIIGTVLTVSSSYLGFQGEGQAVTRLTTTGASQSGIQFLGTSSAVHLSGNFIYDLYLNKSVSATGGIGVYLFHAYGPKLRDIQVADFGFGIELYNAPNTLATRVITSNSSGSFAFHGFHIDGTDPAGNVSSQFRDCWVDANGNSSTLKIGFYAASTAANGSIQDLYFDEISTAGTNYGVYFDFANVNSPQRNFDITFINPVIDQFTAQGMLFANSFNEGAITIVGGWLNPAPTGLETDAIYLQDVRGVSITGTQFYADTNYAHAYGLKMLRAQNIVVSGAQFQNQVYGIYGDTSESNTFTGNKFYNPSAKSALAEINLTTTDDRNVITGNAFDGYATNGVILGASTSLNQTFSNTFGPNITTPYSDSGSNNTNNVTGITPINSGGTNANGFTAKSGNTAGLIFYDGTKLTNNATVTDIGYDTALNKLMIANANVSSLTASTSVITDASKNLISGPIINYGTYTPTLSGGSGINTATSTVYATSYHQIGNQVHVSGFMNPIATSNNAVVSFNMSLPVATNNFTSIVQGNGICAADALLQSAGSASGYVSANSGAQTVVVSWYNNAGATTLNLRFEFDYQVQ